MSILKKAFTLILLLVILGVAGTEAVLWIFFPQPDYPRAEFVFEQDMPGVRPRVDYATSEQSLRVAKWDAAGKREGARRIFFLGGPSTDLFMHADEETWWGRVWKNADAATPFEVEAACKGSEGPGILSGVRWYREHLEEIDADVLVVMYGLGDVLLDGSEYRYDPGKIDRIGSDVPPLWKKIAGNYSQIYRYYRVKRISSHYAARKKVMEEPGFLPALLLDWRRHYAQLPYVEEIARQATHDPLLEYLDGIDRLIELCRITDTRLIVLGEPTLHDAFMGADEVLLLRHSARTGPEPCALSRPNPAWISRELERFYEAARTRCDEEGVPFYMLSRRVPKTHEFFLDDSMLTLRGCERVAEVVTPAVVALLTGGNAPPLPGSGGP